MIHGGAGVMDHIKNEEDTAPYQDSIRGILERGREMLQRGGVALDVVEICTNLDMIKFKQVDAVSATQEAIEYLGDRVNGLGGVIVIDKDGCCS
ncbi:MAG: isoaspartyl peptidase/L-asparaginase [Gammaproteobacteria bacterium]|nr:isoaspartyl peptidase/L-asparaginase [Gammaproteobacteria bacterium]